MKRNYPRAVMATAFSDVKFESQELELTVGVKGEGVRTVVGWHIFPNPDPALVG